MTHKPSAGPSAAPELQPNLLKPLTASLEPTEPLDSSLGAVAVLTGSSTAQELDADEETFPSLSTQALESTEDSQRIPEDDSSSASSYSNEVLPSSDGNETTNETREEEELSTALRTGRIEWTTFKVVMFMVQFVIMVETILGNLMVILSVKMEKKLQTPFNYYIVNLAFTDMNVGISVMSLFMIYNLYEYFPFAAPLCHYWIWSDYTMTFESVMTLAAIRCCVGAEFA